MLKSDVKAALSVLNFAVYHKELTDMEEREQKQRESELKQKTENDAGISDGANHGPTSDEQK